VAVDEIARRGFECPVCEKILREPILTCNGGHSFCDLCKLEDSDNCPVALCSHPDKFRNCALEKIIRDLGLPVACQQHKDGCLYSDVVKNLIYHERQCQHRKIRCPVLSCYQKIGLKKLEEHITTCHDADLGAEEWRYTDLEDASTGKCAPICSSIGSFYEMMSWRQDSVRFFLALFSVWNRTYLRKPWMKLATCQPVCS
jgi:hypothetical protein